MYDIIIVGGGPAGLTAALYALRAGKTVLVIEKNTFGGQMAQSAKIENFPSVESALGVELADKMTEQIINLGAQVELDKVVAITLNGDIKKVTTEFGGNFEAKAVIIATGTKHRKLELENEDELVGKGVCYCAVCDGAFFKGKDVAVNGGGNSALQDAIFLSDICRKVYLIHRRSSFRAEERLVQKLKNIPNVEFILDSSISSLISDGSLCGVTVVNNSGDERDIAIDGLFIAIGQCPDNSLFSAITELDESGYIISGEKCTTKTDGIFVAGDCRTKAIRQVATAVCDGAVAALTACQYIDNL